MKSGVDNMFSSNHYVPILKWKRAEQNALNTLKKEDRNYITPLIQLMMQKVEPEQQLEVTTAEFEANLPKMREQLVKVWGDATMFLDVSLLFTVPLKAKTFDLLLSNAHKSKMIPVIHLHDELEIREAAVSAAKSNESGLCLRLVCTDFLEMRKLNEDLQEFLTSTGLSPASVDLLVDIKETEGSEEKGNKYLNLSQQILNLDSWRTFIFSSGSFPENLSGFRQDEENIIPRIEWNSWLQNREEKKLLREPAFSDYTIQHPVFNPLAQGFHPTASIKYALESDWLIMKGQRQKFEDYLAHAAVLVQDSKFYGENFSDGDGYIKEKSVYFEKYMQAKNEGRDIKGTGTPETWLRAGISHHMSVVARQVSSLL